MGTKFAVQQMLTQQPQPSGDRGWIINTSSILGYVGAHHTAAYCASKGAVLNFTRAAALDCAAHHIHVNGVAPGYTESSMTGPIWSDPEAKAKKEEAHPFRGLGQPEDIAKACVFLASDDAQWVTGVSCKIHRQRSRDSANECAAHSARRRRISGPLSLSVSRFQCSLTFDHILRRGISATRKGQASSCTRHLKIKQHRESSNS